MTSCGAIASETGAAQTMADSLYNCLDRHDYEHIVDNMVHASTTSGEGRQEWLDILKGMEQLGKRLEYKSGFGFNTSIVNGKTTVELSYTCKFEYGTSADKFVLLDDGAGNGMKIRSYQYNYTPNEESPEDSSN